ncbi:SDR family oxidoreductase [Dactylosporangium sp. NPDC051484]|uniref:SDR family NAD(P)-dependent oxidoreductase n=1 Tax=Dactylosporangium sp. NPDC051484 TaxID=3154942 RepID=UPI00344F82A0
MAISADRTLIPYNGTRRWRRPAAADQNSSPAVVVPPRRTVPQHEIQSAAPAGRASAAYRAADDRRGKHRCRTRRSRRNEMTDNKPSLAGMVALVTGSAQGIGQATAVRLAQAGAAVIGVDVSPQDETSERVVQVGGRWWAHLADLADPARIDALVDEVTRTHGRLDILVNNAAIDDPVGFDQLSMDRWDRIMRVNLEAPFRLIRGFVPLMRANQYGRIINISSGSVVNPMTGFVAYRASKMGLIGMTRALSTEVGCDGITANVVSPGVTETAMAMTNLTPEFRAMTITKQGIKRMGQPTDLAATITFLAGPEAGFITGQNIMVNGGAAFTA